MISKKMTAAINDQINKEMYSAYLYLSMSAYASEQNLDGLASWMKLQAQEEMGHAMKFYGYLQEQEAAVKLKAIDAPPTSFASPVKIFQDSLAHEKKVTASIHKLVDLARAEKDYASEIMLQWFVTEQVEEEATAAGILAKLKQIGADPRGLYLIDRELGARGAGH